MLVSANRGNKLDAAYTRTMQDCQAGRISVDPGAASRALPRPGEARRKSCCWDAYPTPRCVPQ